MTYAPMMAFWFGGLSLLGLSWILMKIGCRKRSKDAWSNCKQFGFFALLWIQNAAVISSSIRNTLNSKLQTLLYGLSLSTLAPYLVPLTCYFTPNFANNGDFTIENVQLGIFLVLGLTWLICIKFVRFPKHQDTMPTSDCELVATTPKSNDLQNNNDNINKSVNGSNNNNICKENNTHRNNNFETGSVGSAMMMNPMNMVNSVGSRSVGMPDARERIQVMEAHYETISIQKAAEANRIVKSRRNSKSSIASARSQRSIGTTGSKPVLFSTPNGSSRSIGSNVTNATNVTNVTSSSNNSSLLVDVSKISILSKIQSIIFPVLMLLYPSVCALTFKMIHCEQNSNDEWLLIGRYDQMCFQNSHLPTAILSIAVLLTFVIGFPISGLMYGGNASNRFYLLPKAYKGFSSMVNGCYNTDSALLYQLHLVFICIFSIFGELSFLEKDEFMAARQVFGFMMHLLEVGTVVNMTPYRHPGRSLAKICSIILAQLLFFTNSLFFVSNEVPSLSSPKWTSFLDNSWPIVIFVVFGMTVLSSLASLYLSLLSSPKRRSKLTRSRLRQKMRLKRQATEAILKLQGLHPSVLHLNGHDMENPALGVEINDKMNNPSANVDGAETSKKLVRADSFSGMTEVEKTKRRFSADDKNKSVKKSRNANGRNYEEVPGSPSKYSARDDWDLWSRSTRDSEASHRFRMIYCGKNEETNSVFSHTATIDAQDIEGEIPDKMTLGSRNSCMTPTREQAMRVCPPPSVGSPMSPQTPQTPRFRPLNAGRRAALEGKLIKCGSPIKVKAASATAASGASQPRSKWDDEIGKISKMPSTPLTPLRHRIPRVARTPGPNAYTRGLRESNILGNSSRALRFDDEADDEFPEDMTDPFDPLSPAKPNVSLIPSPMKCMSTASMRLLSPDVCNLGEKRSESIALALETLKKQSPPSIQSSNSTSSQNHNPSVMMNSSKNPSKKNIKKPGRKIMTLSSRSAALSAMVNGSADPAIEKNRIQRNSGGKNNSNGCNPPSVNSMSFMENFKVDENASNYDSRGSAILFGNNVNNTNENPVKSFYEADDECHEVYSLASAGGITRSNSQFSSTLSVNSSGKPPLPRPSLQSVSHSNERSGRSSGSVGFVRNLFPTNSSPSMSCGSVSPMNTNAHSFFNQQQQNRPKRSPPSLPSNNPILPISQLPTSNVKGISGRLSPTFGSNESVTSYMTDIGKSRTRTNSAREVEDVVLELSSDSEEDKKFVHGAEIALFEKERLPSLTSVSKKKKKNSNSEAPKLRLNIPGSQKLDLSRPLFNKQSSGIKTPTYLAANSFSRTPTSVNSPSRSVGI
eukprot:TRINITY_DN44460_c0_g1_i2.p1 TRINITY_DN44460_c0_g1~~TRINITY_DN44460_c0_g1_i2.p1  ORF type:complete len:1316 (-),score=388.05 TRINITY_DN44460_c0_g1_i2:401-4348(-)